MNRKIKKFKTSKPGGCVIYNKLNTARAQNFNVLVKNVGGCVLLLKFQIFFVHYFKPLRDFKFIQFFYAPCIYVFIVFERPVNRTRRCQYSVLFTIFTKSYNAVRLHRLGYQIKMKTKCHHFGATRNSFSFSLFERLGLFITPKWRHFVLSLMGLVPQIIRAQHDGISENSEYIKMFQ